MSVALRLQLRRVVEDEVDFTQRGVALRRERRGAAGDDDARIRMLAAGAADRLARLPLRLRGYGAGVDHDCIGQPGFAAGAADDLALEGVQSAAEGDDLDPGHAGRPPNCAGSK